jgi:hypothetical protein
MVSVVPLIFSPAVFAFAIVVTPRKFMAHRLCGQAALLRCNMSYMRCSSDSVKGLCCSAPNFLKMEPKALET